jgi:hypothetical protein
MLFIAQVCPFFKEPCGAIMAPLFYWHRGCTAESTAHLSEQAGMRVADF